MHLWATTKIRAPPSNNIVCGPWHVAATNYQIWIHFEFENLLILLIPSDVCMWFYHSFTIADNGHTSLFLTSFLTFSFLPPKLGFGASLPFSARCIDYHSCRHLCPSPIIVLMHINPITHHSTNAYQSYWLVITMGDNSLCTAYQCPKCGNKDFMGALENCSESLSA